MLTFAFEFKGVPFTLHIHSDMQTWEVKRLNRHLTCEQWKRIGFLEAAMRTYESAIGTIK
jgi:hypothetical protein